MVEWVAGLPERAEHKVFWHKHRVQVWWRGAVNRLHPDVLCWSDCAWSLLWYWVRILLNWSEGLISEEFPLLLTSKPEVIKEIWVIHRGASKPCISACWSHRQSLCYMILLRGLFTMHEWMNSSPTCSTSTHWGPWTSCSANLLQLVGLKSFSHRSPLFLLDVLFQSSCCMFVNNFLQWQHQQFNGSLHWPSSQLLFPKYPFHAVPQQDVSALSSVLDQTGTFLLCSGWLRHHTVWL